MENIDQTSIKPSIQNVLNIISKTSIWIYVTDIETESQMGIATKTLNAESSILKWSIDTEDIDNVLRVETTNLDELYIQLALQNQGLTCIPMMD